MSLRPSAWLRRAFYEVSSSTRYSRGVGRVSDLRLPRPVLDRMIATYCRVYGTSLDECVVPEGGFDTFDQFFTRRMKPGMRPVDMDPGVVVSPADGTIQGIGEVTRGKMIQAKGRSYRLEELLGDKVPCARLEGGTYVTVYLSPRDYHRVHFPCDGEITGCRHIPGRLYTVAPRATEVVERLFARNERLTTLLQCAGRTAAVVMVGAVGVGRISVAYGPMVTNVGRHCGSTSFDSPIAVRKGADLGEFHLGSTVVMVLERGPWDYVGPSVGAAIRMGEPLLRVRPLT